MLHPGTIINLVKRINHQNGGVLVLRQAGTDLGDLLAAIDEAAERAKAMLCIVHNAKGDATMKKISSFIEHDTWTVITVGSKNVPPDVYKALKQDPLASRVHGGYQDLLFRHGDDGGWCVDLSIKSRAYKWLERVRRAAEFPRFGQVFYLVVRTA